MIQKRNKLKLITKTYVGILSLLGLTSCHNSPLEPICEYGVPHADQLIKGKVVNSDARKKGIQNIQLTLKPEYAQKEDTIFSKADGSFELKRVGFSANEKFKIEVKDIDGEKNGLYNDTIIDIQLKQTKKGKNTWDNGLGEANIIIPLKPKK